MERTSRIAPYVLLSQGGEYELVEKKSRFLAKSFPVSSEEEVLARLEEVRKKHYDARHNCYAYCYGERFENTRISDDGEPAGTAGRPIFDVIEGVPVTGCLIVVTRYFGGILLGTGGLVRAYGGAAAGVLKASVLVKRFPGEEYSLSADYGEWGKLQYYFGTLGLTPLEQEFTDVVRCRIRVREEEAASFVKGITELSSGRISPVKEGECRIEEVFNG